MWCIYEARNATLSWSKTFDGPSQEWSVVVELSTDADPSRDLNVGQDNRMRLTQDVGVVSDKVEIDTSQAHVPSGHTECVCL
jgi:hypothetical protein